MDLQEDGFSPVLDEWDRMIGVPRGHIVLVRCMYTTHCVGVCMHFYVICVCV